MTLEFEYLLQEISTAQPCGMDCSFSHDFHAIKKARTRDDPLLDQGDWVTEPKQADWQFVNDKVIELLCEKTKDLRLYTWLIEAWSHLYGFNGIAKGLELIQKSLDHYWLELHPVIEEDNLDQRLGLLQGLIVQLPMLMKQVPLISTPPFYSVNDYETFLHQRNLQLKQQDYVAESDPVQDLEYFEQLLLNTPKTELNQNDQFLQQIQMQWQQLKTILDQLLGSDAPSFAATDSQIDLILSSIKRIYKKDTLSEILLDPVDSSTSQNSEARKLNVLHSNSDLQNFQPQAQNHLANRQQAMQLLKEIAEYFRTHEPHSPVSYMLQKTIQWSQMPLHKWLAQVIKNENPIENVHELLGVHGNNESDNEW
ncbi:MAG: type VI secretion system protein TssA [Acinetobacter sp.]